MHLLRWRASFYCLQVRDGIHTMLAQAVLEKWQQASNSNSNSSSNSSRCRLRCRQHLASPTPLLSHVKPNKPHKASSLHHLKRTMQHSSSAHGNSVRLQLLQAFAMVVKVGYNIYIKPLFSVFKAMTKGAARRAIQPPSFSCITFALLRIPLCHNL